MFTPFARGAVYAGIDPTGKRAFIRMLVTEMTREQLAAWFLIDPATASRYIYPAEVKETPVTVPVLDNNPGAPAPKPYKAHGRKA